MSCDKVVSVEKLFSVTVDCIAETYEDADIDWCRVLAAGSSVGQDRSLLSQKAAPGDEY
jgi:hypothetical protein